MRSEEQARATVRELLEPISENELNDLCVKALLIWRSKHPKDLQFTVHGDFGLEIVPLLLTHHGRPLVDRDTLSALKEPFITDQGQPWFLGISDFLVWFTREGYGDTIAREKQNIVTIRLTRRGMEFLRNLDNSAALEANPSADPPVPPTERSLEQPSGIPGSGITLMRDFSRETPCLNTGAYANALAAILAQASGEICFALFGHWGRGKTFLAKLVARSLQSSDSTSNSSNDKTTRPVYDCIVFSAWKYRSTPELWAHLYESFLSALMQAEWWRRVPRVFRANLHRHGMGPLVEMLIGVGLAAIPLSSKLYIALKVLGVLGVVRGALLYFRHRARVASVFSRFFSTKRHVEKLGLQATIGSDLESLTIGWVGQLAWSRARLGLAVALYAVSVLILLIGLWLGFRHEASLSKWLQLYPPEVDIVPILIGIGAIAIVLPLWLLCAGRNKQRILLIVDDLDRVPSAQSLEIIESLKLFLENDAISDRIQLLVICEEDSLKRALADKYGEHPRALEENLQKLFIGHLRMPSLSFAEQEEVLMYRIGTIVDVPAPVVNAANSASVVQSNASAKPLAATQSAHRKPPQAEFTDDDRRALQKGLKQLGAPNSAWAALGPRAIQSYVLRYLLARRLLAARHMVVVPELLATSLAARMHAGGPQVIDHGGPFSASPIEGVISEVA